MRKYINKELLKTNMEALTESELEAKFNEATGAMFMGAMKMEGNPSPKDMLDFAEGIILLAGLSSLDL